MEIAYVEGAGRVAHIEGGSCGVLGMWGSFGLGVIKFFLEVQNMVSER